MVEVVRGDRGRGGGGGSSLGDRGAPQGGGDRGRGSLSVSLLPGGEIDERDGDGVTWNQGITEILWSRMFLSTDFYLHGRCFSKCQRLHQFDVISIVTSYSRQVRFPDLKISFEIKINE